MSSYLFCGHVKINEHWQIEMTRQNAASQYDTITASLNNSVPLLTNL